MNAILHFPADEQDEPEVPQDEIDAAIAIELRKVPLGIEEILGVRGHMTSANAEDHQMLIFRRMLADAMDSKSSANMMALAWEVVGLARTCMGEDAADTIRREA